MNADVPKQFLPLSGKPVLMHTISAFSESDYKPEIIVVLNAGYHDYWLECCSTHSFTFAHTLVGGGETRFDSVKKGLSKITDEAVVAIHDAVRPVISNQIISNSFKVAEEKGNAVAAITSRDSVRQLKGGISQAIDRNTIYLIQTPQTFKSEIIKKAYEQLYSADFTDDAGVVERMGLEINLIEGDSRNIKITFSEDIAIAEYFLKKKKPGEPGF